MIRVGVVGTGHFARQHIAVLRQLPGVEVGAVVGSDPRRTSEVAREAGDASPYSSISSMLSEARIDAVDVVNRTGHHATATIEALEAALPVLVDKPAALSVEDFDRMLAAADKDSRRLMVGQTVRFHPVMRMIQKSIADGDIGEPKVVHLSWHVGYTWAGGWRSWQMDPAQSGGHLVHNGVHIIDAASWLLGEAPCQLTAIGTRTWAGGMSSPDSFQIIGKTPSGKLCALQWSYGLKEFKRMERRYLVLGGDGTIVHDTANENAPTQLDGFGELPSVEGALTAELTHWIDLVRGDAEPVVRLSEVRSVLAAALAAQRSFEQGTVATTNEVLGNE